MSIFRLDLEIDRLGQPIVEQQHEPGPRPFVERSARYYEH
jgi:hypothetical protein